ncbi:MAG: c-type cytochrome [Gammaproteobacteria bacterium]|nr:c-type cytochrome [Gammaproteobacteria bacterium]MDH4253632.1 c-type cytochrome [Gammaproteobacteria bacterium]MDH5309748.1 c-type cytochrome [Gammaproteobacteria bacterium]
MSTLKMIALAGLVLPAAASAQDGPGLGEPLTAEQVAALDFVVMPDGSGLPDGSGDARTGAELYRQHCLACHGENGRDGVSDALAGGHGTIEGPVPEKTVGSYWPYATTVFDYIRRAMPYQEPGSLSEDEVYALTAYLLYLNEIVDEDQVLDRATLPAVRMPNRDNFVWAFEARQGR